METPLNVALIVCTRNRAAQLETALRPFAALEGGTDDWELVIVNNGSPII